MKRHPELPELPARYHWEVVPSRAYSFVHVKLVGPSALGYQYVYASGTTRNWPKPSFRTVARTARKLHRDWLKEQARLRSPLAGSYVGGRK